MLLTSLIVKVKNFTVAARSYMILRPLFRNYILTLGLVLPICQISHEQIRLFKSHIVVDYLQPQEGTSSISRPGNTRRVAVRNSLV